MGETDLCRQADVGSAHMDAAPAESPKDWFSRLSRRSHHYRWDLGPARTMRPIAATGLRGSTSLKGLCKFRGVRACARRYHTAALER